MAGLMLHMLLSILIILVMGVKMKRIICFGVILVVLLVSGCEIAPLEYEDAKGVRVEYYDRDSYNNIEIHDYGRVQRIYIEDDDLDFDLYAICDDGVVCYEPSTGASCFRIKELTDKYCGLIAIGKMGEYDSTFKEEWKPE